MPESNMDENRDREDSGYERVDRLRTFEMPYALGNKQRSLRTYTLGAHEDQYGASEMQTGAWKEVIEEYRARGLKHLISDIYSEKYADIPYVPLHAQNGALYGDYTTASGQDEFMDSDLVVAEDAFSPPPWASDLWRFAKLKQSATFAYDSSLACLRGLDVVNGSLRFTVGEGMYSDSFYSMGSEGVGITLTESDLRHLEEMKVSSEHMAELESLYQKLFAQYGEVTLREAVLAHTGGNLPAYNDHVYNSVLGVAGTVLTADNEYVFVRRGVNVAINRGINVTASGAVDFNKDALSSHGLAGHLGREMSRESSEELGLKSGTLLLGAMRGKLKIELGIPDESEYDLIPVGFARELPRGGSPEAMFLIRYKGSTDDLVRTIMRNPHASRVEIDTHVYAMPTANANELLQHRDGTKVIQHKAALNLIFIQEWLKQNG